MEKLATVLLKFSSSSKHAAWLIVESACQDHFSRATRERGKDQFFAALTALAVNPYAKYRLLHHAVKQSPDANGRPSHLLSRLTGRERTKLREILTEHLVPSPAFELGITALFALKKLNVSAQELEELVAKTNIHQRNVEPFQNAVSLDEFIQRHFYGQSS